MFRNNTLIYDSQGRLRKTAPALLSVLGVVSLALSYAALSATNPGDNPGHSLKAESAEATDVVHSPAPTAPPAPATTSSALPTMTMPLGPPHPPAEEAPTYYPVGENSAPTMQETPKETGNAASPTPSRGLSDEPSTTSPTSGAPVLPSEAREDENCAVSTASTPAPATRNADTAPPCGEEGRATGHSRLAPGCGEEATGAPGGPHTPASSFQHRGPSRTAGEADVDGQDCGERGCVDAATYPDGFRATDALDVRKLVTWLTGECLTS